MVCDGELLATSRPPRTSLTTRQTRQSTFIIVGLHMAIAHLAQSVATDYAIAADMARLYSCVSEYGGYVMTKDGPTSHCSRTGDGREAFT
jgi:hypothetical protein